MAECLPNNKVDQLSKENISSMSNILKMLLAAFNLPQRPAIPAPLFLLLAGAKKRSGISSRRMAAKAISRIEAEAGIPMGDVFADGPNKAAAAVFIQMQEIKKEIVEHSSGQAVLGPGGIQIVVQSPYGPLPGTNVMPVGLDVIVG